MTDHRKWLLEPDGNYSHVEGWTSKRRRELWGQFQSLDYRQITEILAVVNIHFAGSVLSIPKGEIFAAIIDDWDYETVRREITIARRSSGGRWQFTGNGQRRKCFRS